MNDALLDSLKTVRDPSGDGALSDTGRVTGLDLRDGVATVLLKAGGPDEDAAGLRAEIEAAVTARPEVSRARVIIEGPAPAKKAKPRVNAGGGTAPIEAPAKRVIAVGSGKGGVGKSTVAANLAVAAARSGLKVGFMDADVYGPSGPRLFGLTGAPGLRKTDDGIVPLEAAGIKMVSMGFIVGEREAVVWRGPMVTGAIRQFLGEVDWGDLDLLIIDMPPGTGDAQLAIAQSAPITGAVIVSTPQDLALDDAKKAIALFDKTEIPVLGVVENMSVFICPHCGEATEIFGHGGARAEAERLGAPFLGEIPLHPELREASDAGVPAALGDGPVAKAFRLAAERLIESADAAHRPAPVIRFED